MTNTIPLTFKVLIETSVTNNSSVQKYPHSDDHTELCKLHIQLFRERLSNKTVRDGAERYCGGKYGFMVFD